MERKLGSLRSPKDLRDYKIAKVSKTTEALILPEEFSIPASSIKDQGVVGSCVAHALSSMLEKNGINYSTGWIYGYRPDGYWQGEGMYPREALKTILNLGAVEHMDFPYNIEMDQAKSIVNQNINRLTSKAEEYKIQAYARLNSNQEIKEFLYKTKTAIPLSILVADEGLNIDSNNKFIVPSNFNNIIGGHMMLIIGWNKDGFILQNSWGYDWGSKGTAILPYEYPIDEAWGVTLKSQEENTTDDIIIQKPTLYLIRELLQKILDLIMGMLK